MLFNFRKDCSNRDHPECSSISQSRDPLPPGAATLAILREAISFQSEPELAELPGPSPVSFLYGKDPRNEAGGHSNPLLVQKTGWNQPLFIFMKLGSNIWCSVVICFITGPPSHTGHGACLEGNIKL